MKILALADRRINEDIIQLIEDNQIGLVLLLGDLKFIDIEELKNTQIPIFGVYGNHCVDDYFPYINALNLHLNTTEFNGYTFLGFEGCPYYKGFKHEYEQDKAESLLNNQPSCNILISHSPASGINSTDSSPHQGFTALTKYIETHQPTYFFHGHSYPDKEQKISKYKKTIVFYISGYEIIDLNNLPTVIPNSTTYK